jgi:cytochrome c556
MSSYAAFGLARRPSSGQLAPRRLRAGESMSPIGKLHFGAVAGLAAACGLVLAGLAQAQDAPASAGALLQKPEDVVAGRRAAYLLSGAVFSSFRGVVERGEDVKNQEFSARMLANWARVLPRMFPDGTNVAPTHANPNVWTDRAGFEAKAQIYAAAATKLADLAAANDKAGFAAQVPVVREACNGCHAVYHRKEATSDGKH